MISVPANFHPGDQYSYESVTQVIDYLHGTRPRVITFTRTTSGWWADDGREVIATDAEIAQAMAADNAQDGAEGGWFVPWSARRVTVVVPDEWATAEFLKQIAGIEHPVTRLLREDTERKMQMDAARERLLDSLGDTDATCSCEYDDDVLVVDANMSTRVPVSFECFRVIRSADVHEEGEFTNDAFVGDPSASGSA